MRIGVDATCWSNRRGYGRFTRALLSAVLDLDRSTEYVFFADDFSSEFPFPAGVELVRVNTEVPTVKAAAADGRRSLKDLWKLSRAIGSARLDLIFFPSIYSYVPVACRAPKLVTVHDVIAELYPELIFPSFQSKLFWRAKRVLGCAQARLVITVSEYSRHCLAEHLHIAPSRLRVVQEASAPVFRRLVPQDGKVLLRRLRIPCGARYLVYLGGFSPHKNLALLIEVFRELRSEEVFHDLHLVLVGDYSRDVFYSCYPAIVAQVRQSGLEEHVTFSGYLADEDIAQLLTSAAALVLPSFCEGVGLPALEAAACGAPVVVTRHSPLQDLLGSGAISLDPGDRHGWRDAIARILCEPELSERMRTAGMAATARLSWSNSACQLLAIFEEVLGERVASS